MHGLYLRSKDTCIRPYQGLVQLVVVGTHRAAKAALWPQQSCQWDTKSFSVTTAVLPMGHKELPCDESSLANGTQRASLRPQQSCQWDTKSFSATTAVLPMGHKELPCDHSSLANGTQSFSATTAVLPMGHKELLCDHSSLANGTQRAALWPQQSCQWDTKSFPVTSAVLPMGHKEFPCDHSSLANGTQRVSLWPQQSCQRDTRLRMSCTLGRHWLPSRRSYSYPFLHHIKTFFLFFQHRTNPISRTSTSHGTNNTRNVSFPTDCNNSLLQIQDKNAAPWGVLTTSVLLKESSAPKEEFILGGTGGGTLPGRPTVLVAAGEKKGMVWSMPSSPPFSVSLLSCTQSQQTHLHLIVQTLAATHHSMPIFPTTNVHCQSVFGCRTIDGATDNKLTHN